MPYLHPRAGEGSGMRELVIEFRSPQFCLCKGARLVQGWDTETGERFLIPCPHCTDSRPLRKHLEKK